MNQALYGLLSLAKVALCLREDVVKCLSGQFQEGAGAIIKGIAGHGLEAVCKLCLCLLQELPFLLQPLDRLNKLGLSLHPRLLFRCEPGPDILKVLGTLPYLCPQLGHCSLNTAGYDQPAQDTAYNKTCCDTKGIDHHSSSD